MLIDSHAHLNFPDYREKLEQIITDAKNNGVEKIINIGTSLSDSAEAIDLAKKYEGLYATVGIHPNDNLQAIVDNIDWEKFEDLAKSPKVVAIGECGLDYTNLPDHQTTGLPETEKLRQKKLFQKQLETARKLNLPLSIHIRGAQIDVMSEFAKVLQETKGVFHCFSGDEVYLDFILEKLPGFYLSFAGNVTFKNAKELQGLARLAPIDRILVETDCPFLAPEPLRGTQNVPANVKMTAQKLADVKGLSLDETSRITSTNATTLFGFTKSS